MSESTGAPDALPWAQVPHWVILAPISREAKLLYVFLVAHVDRRDPDNRLAWPTQRRLAKLVGLAKEETVRLKMKELEAIGAVQVRHGQHPTQPMRTRNTYVVRLAADPAPSNLDLPLSVWSIGFDLDEDEAPESSQPPATGGSVANSLDFDPWASPDPPSQGGRESRPEGGCSTPPQGGNEERPYEDPRKEEQTLPAPQIGAGAPSKQTSSKTKVSNPTAPPKIRDLMDPCSLVGCLRGVLKDDSSPLGMTYCPEHYDIRDWTPPWLTQGNRS